MSPGARCLERMEALFLAYHDKVRELERNRKPGDGLLGLKGGPADDPCHDRFAEELDACLADFAADQPASAEVRSVLERLYAAPPKDSLPLSAYWMCIAVQGLRPELIDRLTPEDAGALAVRYADDFRRWERLPVQKKILAALKAKSKE